MKRKRYENKRLQKVLKPHDISSSSDDNDGESLHEVGTERIGRVTNGNDETEGIHDNDHIEIRNRLRRFVNQR